MSGLLIIEGLIEEHYPELASLTERVMLLRTSRCLARRMMLR